MNLRLNTRAMIFNACEPLEARQLLTTLSGGSTFVYKDTANHDVTIQLNGSVRAEFIGARYDAANNKMVVGNLIGASSDSLGRNLFAVYVHTSDATGSISISSSPDAANGAITLGVERAGAYVQARTLDSAIGVRPAGTLYAGFTVRGTQDFGSFMFDGDVTGRVSVGGSMRRFYCENLWTGRPNGQGFFSNPEIARNFSIGGDLRELIVNENIGTDTTDLSDLTDVLNTGFDARVGGVLGSVVVGGSILGGLRAAHDPNVTPLRRSQQEIESYVGSWAGGDLIATDYYNDSLATAQQLGSIFNEAIGKYPGVRMLGALETTPDPDEADDLIDFYAVPLIGGQSITVQLRDFDPNRTGFLNVGVFDPAGRLVASDCTWDGSRQGQRFQVTATSPGLYKIAVAPYNDTDFSGNGYEYGAMYPYDLRVTGLGDMGLGSIQADYYFDGRATLSGLSVQNGDLGAVTLRNDIFSFGARTIEVERGGLRVLSADQLGMDTDGGIVPVGAGPTLKVRKTVGLVTSDTDMALNTNTNESFAGQYQVVDAGDLFYGEISSNGAIGIIRAGNMASDAPSTIRANANGTNRDGVIDLIDVENDMGTIFGGGPAISTGFGGNVRYMRVGGEIWRDRFFGSGNTATVSYAAGREVVINDDSGAAVTFDAGPSYNDPANPGTKLGPTMEITSYGIRGSGGSVILKVKATPQSGTNQPNNAALRISTDGQIAEVCEVEIEGPGQAVATDINGVMYLDTTTNVLPQSVSVSSGGRIDLWHVTGTAMTELVNFSGGEIVNVEASSIGKLHARRIGTARSSTGAAVEPRGVVSNVFPFNELHTGIDVGDMLDVMANEDVGNIVSSGSINSIKANADGRAVSGVFEGITHPIFAAGKINNINIGEGVLSSGGGEAPAAGIFANDAIGAIRGSGANIYGDIASLVSIGSIDLNNGSIIDADIMIVTDLAMTLDTSLTIEMPGSIGTIENPVFTLGDITIMGNGGIIGAVLAGSDIDVVKIANTGFGVIGSTFVSVGNGVIGGVETGGLGIRNTALSGGATLWTMEARGNGATLDLRNFSGAVRRSGSVTIDPYTGFAPSATSDLYLALGTTPSAPKVKGVTDSGVIQNVLANGSRNANNIQAWQIRNSTFNFANKIDTIRTTDSMKGVDVVTGELTLLSAGYSLASLGTNDSTITVAGPIGTVKLGSSLWSNSLIEASGPNGRIGTVTVGKDLLGRIRASKTIGLVTAAGKETGTVTANGRPVNIV